MKLKLIPLILIFSLLLGCAATTPRDRYADIQDAAISALVIVQEARAAGDINDKDWETTVVPAVKVLDTALDRYDELSKLGEPTADTESIIRLALADLRPFVVAWVSK